MERIQGTKPDRPARAFQILGLGLAGLGLALAGCMATARLSERRQAYAAAFKSIARRQSDLAARTVLLQGLLQRTTTPYAAPYPDLVAGLRRLSGDLDSLKRGQDDGRGFEGDFDAFAKGQAPVLTKRSPAWPQYQSLDGRFRALQADQHARRQAFDADRDAFDGLTKAASIVHFDPTALGPTLDAINQELNDGLHRMEGRVRQVQASVTFQKSVGGDATLLGGERDTLESMQTHLFRSGSLVRRALLLSDKVRASGPAPDGLWAGPGLAVDGSDWAKLLGLREAFRRRRAEFKALSQAFTALEASIPESVPVQ